MSAVSEMPAPRWSVHAPVKLRAAPEGPDWRTLNISATGMFVSGELLLDAGSEFDVDIALPDAFGASLKITSRVEVVWARDPVDERPNLPSGMGMRFVDIAAPMKRALKAYLDDVAARQSSKKLLEATAAVPPPPPVLLLDEIVSPTKAPTVVVPVSARANAVARSADTPPPPPVELHREIKPGDKLGRYTIIERIGAGGMGDVFLAEHTSLGRRVALKRLQEQHVHDRLALRRFYDEARLVNQIHHDNIVQITDLVVGDTDVFIVMELLVGPTLAQELSRYVTMPLSRTAAIGRQICDALEAVHRADIVHRDLKPGNIMLVDRYGNPDFVKLLDFGIAKLREVPLDRPRTLADQVVGTPGFMAPEQLLGEPVDIRADLYSLGVVLFVMLTGRMPFIASSSMEMMLCQVQEKALAPSKLTAKALPKALDAMVLRCLEREPRNRPGSAAEIAAVLHGLTRADG